MKEYKLKINGNDYKVVVNSVEGQEMHLDVNGKPFTVTLDREAPQSRPAATPRPTAAATAAAPKPAAAAKGSKVTTPLPGTILDIFVNVGDTVKEGQTVALLEAMKMENNIEADAAGTVKEVKVRKGDSVLEGDVLVVIE